MATRIEAWLTAACADADRRGLPDLKPLLESLARSTTALRDAEETWRGAQGSGLKAQSGSGSRAQGSGVEDSKG
jgi:hypothetical protein